MTEAEARQLAAEEGLQLPAPTGAGGISGSVQIVIYTQATNDA